ncbi:MAG: ATP-binding protein [Nitrospira sp.]|nr:ATP-binding protein [Nitrospira sp.]MDH4245424.1 ATP-binding protein [Nitrospira sp.]MDH5320523.1 ATP-binding protein [Nitrospira sp.]
MMDWPTAEKTGAAASAPTIVHANLEGERDTSSAIPVPMKVAIVGAGRGGTALLEVLHQIRTIDIVGITDKDRSAPGLHRAHELNVPVYGRTDDLLHDQPLTLVMDVTGDPAMESALRQQKPTGADVISGQASRLFWLLVQHESTLQTELLQAEKMAGFGSFAAGIAHDMNNPLQLILGMAENLAEETDLEAVHAQALDIIDAVKRTTAICRDLTSYSRRTSVRQDGLIQVNSKLDEALKIARYAVALQDIEIRKHYHPDVVVKGNPDKLLHVFVNLITNAVQGMEHHGILTLESTATAGGTQVRVSDTGCGIAPELLTRIFEPFYTTKPPGKGTGLGLYNIKNVIQHMHGTIEVESHVGQGSTFTLTFPGDPSLAEENGQS